LARFGLLPDQAGAAVPHGAVAVRRVTIGEWGLPRPEDTPRMVSLAAAGTDGLALRMRSGPTARVYRPDSRRVVRARLRSPPIFCVRFGKGAVDGGFRIFVVEDTEQFLVRRQPPAGLAGQCERAAVFLRALPCHLTAVLLLPQESGS